MSRSPLTRFSRGSVTPKEIKKKRVLKGVESFEILWHDSDKCFDALFPEAEIACYLAEHPEGIETLWCTVEPKNLVETAYPAIFDEFTQKTSKKKSKTAKKTAKRTKAETSLNNLSDLLEALPKVAKKSKAKAKEVQGVPSIKTFFEAKPLQDLEVPSDFSDLDENETFSEILDKIVQQKPELSRLGSQELFYDEEPVTISKENQNPNTSTPSSGNYKKFLLDDSLLRRVARKSYVPEYNNASFDDFVVEFDDRPMAAEQSFFFEKVDNESCDIFESTLNELTGQ